MPRRYINQLAERETVDEVYLVADKQLRANRNGNLYLQLRMTDKTGSLTGMLWNVTEQLGQSVEVGHYLRVQGTTQLYNGGMQMIVTRIDPVDATKVDEADFQSVSTAEIDALASRLAEMLRGMTSAPLRDLAECFLVDENFMTKFTQAPAGIKNHHAYRGGLLAHVVSLMELCAVVAARYPEIDPDMLRIGVFLHDAGKINELTYERELGYSDEGQLIGHIVMAVSMVEEKVRDYQQLTGETFPQEMLLRIKHMILSHHGEYEFGSPKLPMTLEAIALHYLDNLDAKIYAVGQLLREDINSESPWTTYNAPLARKFYKGSKPQP
ncbi:metal dependent phosphohydrolase [Pirellula staleyi DSM 6068]|uniref:Metal dependent phosphohydrolase n=1 Tax=Pirellula staleyi (strain ATCC 27377 / DSM 6068 / ICPB 4128) TaxID=530564 RepID=D2R7Z8_PIRSD|nr:HD domain-containing protein [Pirellula staleyi]ADB19329.1 metal dependent phosphohydrolase [Pirellula staleyi DSM 6068]